MYSGLKYLFWMIIEHPAGEPAEGNNNQPSGGLPHSEIRGSKPILGSPRLIAEYHVLHRLLLPRHPPNALLALDLIQKKTDAVKCATASLLERRIACATASLLERRIACATASLLERRVAHMSVRSFYARPYLAGRDRSKASLSRPPSWFVTGDFLRAPRGTLRLVYLTWITLLRLGVAPMTRLTRRISEVTDVYLSKRCQFIRLDGQALTSVLDDQIGWDGWLAEDLRRVLLSPPLQAKPAVAHAFDHQRSKVVEPSGIEPLTS